MNTILLTTIITLLVYWLIGTIVYIATDDNYKFAAYYTIGIIGLIVSGFCYIVRLIKRWWFNHDKRSIFEDENGNRFYCEVKYANDFNWHYDMVKRYATKDEWQNLTPFTKEQIKLAQRNCDRCKHDGSCTFDMWRASLDKIKCKHDNFGTVTEFDKFERKQSMEKYFEVKKNSDFYKKYFDYIDMSNKVNELFKQFAKDNGIETKKYYQNTERLVIVPTQEDRIKFKGMFVQNSDTDFKKTAPICQSWINLCKENDLKSPSKPSLLWDSSCKLGSYSTSSRLFHIGENVYGSIDNKCNTDIELTDDFVEMKASEFWKIVEDAENKQAINHRIYLENKNMSNGYMKKSISWYQLHKRIGKQTLHKTRNTKVQVLIDGELKECALVFTNNGSDFHLEPVGKVVTDDNSRTN